MYVLSIGAFEYLVETVLFHVTDYIIDGIQCVSDTWRIIGSYQDTEVLILQCAYIL